MAGIAFEQHEVELNGGSLYAFSDGATDVRDADGKRLGNDGVRELIKRHATMAPDARLRALLSDLKHLKLVDDTTLLLIEKPRAHDAQVLLEHHMPARAEYLRDMRNALRKLLDQLGIEPALRDRLVLAVDEACTNIIRHAYGGQGAGGIGLRVSRADDVLSFELTDDAPCIDPDRMRPKPLGECRAGGLGVALIDTVMDTWHVEPASARCGNRLVLRKRIEDKGSDRGGMRGVAIDKTGVHMSGIASETIDGYVLIRLSGEVDLSWSQQVRHAVLAALESHPAVGVELSEVSYIDSSGIAALVEGFQNARARGSRFALVAVSDAVRAVLELARLDRVFLIVSDPASLGEA